VTEFADPGAHEAKHNPHPAEIDSDNPVVDALGKLIRRWPHLSALGSLDRWPGPDHRSGDRLALSDDSVPPVNTVT